MSEITEEITTKANNARNTGQVKILKTTKIRKIVQSEFNPRFEHDAHEFFLYLANKLKDEVTEKSAKTDFREHTNDSLTLLMKNFPSCVDQLFTVVEKTSIHCKKCRKSVHALQYHLTLPL